MHQPFLMLVSLQDFFPLLGSMDSSANSKEREQKNKKTFFIELLTI
jgi:hypothetical protein